MERYELYIFELMRNIAWVRIGHDLYGNGRVDGPLRNTVTNGFSERTRLLIVDGSIYSGFTGQLKEI